MEKIFNKFSKYIFEILVLLIIIVIGLYIIHFAESITDKTEKLLAAFAATLSTFFLFLAFWQSKLSNELKINEPRFKRYEKEITELERKSNEFIFTKDKTQEINCGIKYFDNVINNITYLNINKELISLFNHIEADTKYKDYTLLLGEKPQILLNSHEEDAQKLGLLLNLIQSCLFRIKNHFINIFFQYFNIDKSDLDYRQRKFLIETLNRFNYPFKNLYDEIKSDTEDGILLSSFRLFTCIDGKTIIRTKMANFDAIISLYERVEEINKKYI